MDRLVGSLKFQVSPISLLTKVSETLLSLVGLTCFEVVGGSMMAGWLFETCFIVHPENGLMILIQPLHEIQEHLFVYV